MLARSRTFDDIPYDPTVASGNRTLTGRALALLAVVLAAAGPAVACSRGAATDAGPTVDELLAASAVAMSDVTSAAFTIEQSGAEFFIDENGQLAFRSADGRYAAPASAEALVTVDALGFTTQVGAVAIEGTVWLSDPLTGNWAEAPESFAFDPATLFDSEQGFPALLTEGQGRSELLSSDETSHRIRTPVSAERLSVLTSGLVEAATDVELTIDAGTDRISEATFELPVADQTSSWRLALDQYDEPVTVERPDLGA